jgi:inner membrane transporter RhtA
MSEAVHAFFDRAALDHTGVMTDRPTSTAAGVATLLGSALSNQVGAAVGSFAFGVIGPVGVVVVRQFVAAAVLLPIARPRFWTFSRAQWWPVLLLALVFGAMNLGLYTAIDRIGLGLAVTLEFLGPLAIAIAGSRSRGTVLCAAAAVAGVAAIMRPEPTTDYVGIAFGLLAAACWAAYILLNRAVGKRLPGVQGTATAAGVSALVFVPVAIAVFVVAPPTPVSLVYAVTAGVLASAVPYVADLIALRRVPARLFSLLMSVQPVFAALVGAVLLSQRLGPLEWAGVALIVGANVGALMLARRAQSRSSSAYRRTAPE